MGIIIENYQDEKLCDFSKDFIKSINESQFEYRSLSDEEKETIYQNFYNAYMKSVGSSWDRDTFDYKASGWIFFGSKNGGVCVRKQNSGMYKINASYGYPREVIKGFQEMQSSIGNNPVWSVTTEEICVMLEKLTKNDKEKKFKQAPKSLCKIVLPHIKYIFGGEVEISSSGSLIATAPDGKKLEKFFIANKIYYNQLLDNAMNNPDKLPVPQSVLSTMVTVVKLFLKFW